MAYQTNTYLKSRYETGDIPTQTDYSDLIDSFLKNRQTATLNASGETSMIVAYFGDTAPTLAKTAAGEYTLTVPTGVILKGFHWLESGGTLTASGSVKLTITDADGNLLFGVFQGFSDTSGDQAQQSQGFVLDQDTPSAGNIVVEFANAGSISGDWRIVGVICL